MKIKLVSALLYAGFILPSFAADVDVPYENTNATVGSVTLNFDSDGGTECTSLTLIISEPPASCTLPEPVKAGHKFLGWYCGDKLVTNENPYDAFETVALGQTTTLKAKWEKANAETSTSSIVKDEISGSDEYYETIHRRDNFSDGSRIETATKTKKIEDYTIEENITVTYFHPDGSVSTETKHSHNGYEGYLNAYSKNTFNASVTDKNGKPISGAAINFKTDAEDINLTADSNGKISHAFDSSLTYMASIISVPEGYVLHGGPEKQESEHDGYISYTEKYILDSAATESATASGNTAGTTAIKESHTETSKPTASGDTPSTNINRAQKDKTKTAASTNKNAASIKTPVVLESEKVDSSVKEPAISTPQTGDGNGIILYGCLNALALLGIIHSKNIKAKSLYLLIPYILHLHT